MNSLERRRRETTLRSKMRTLIIGESEKIAGMEDVVIPNECLQLVYHRAVRRHLLILYPKEILIMDLGIKQVGTDFFPDLLSIGKLVPV